MRRRDPHCNGFGPAVAFVALSLGLLACGSAAAGDAACLWRRLPHPLRATIIDAYAKHGSDGLSEIDISNDLVRDLVRACSRTGAIDDQAAQAAGAALVGKALVAASADRLKAAYNVDPRRLVHAWAALSAGERAALQRQFSGVEPSPAEDAALFAAILHGAELAGWRSRGDGPSMNDPEFRAYADYFTGRTQSQAFETRF